MFLNWGALVRSAPDSVDRPMKCWPTWPIAGPEKSTRTVALPGVCEPEVTGTAAAARAAPVPASDIAVARHAAAVTSENPSRLIVLIPPAAGGDFSLGPGPR